MSDLSKGTEEIRDLVLGSFSRVIDNNRSWRDRWVDEDRATQEISEFQSQQTKKILEAIEAYAHSKVEEARIAELEHAKLAIWHPDSIRYIDKRIAYLKTPSNQEGNS